MGRHASRSVGGAPEGGRRPFRSASLVVVSALAVLGVTSQAPRAGAGPIPVHAVEASAGTPGVSGRASDPACDPPAGVAVVAGADLRVFDPSGALLAVPSAGLTRSVDAVRASADGSVLVWHGYLAEAGRSGLFASDADGSDARQLSDQETPWEDEQFVVSDDGRWVVWGSGMQKFPFVDHLYAAPTSGLGPTVELNPPGTKLLGLPAISPDGTHVAWVGTAMGKVTEADVWQSSVLGGSPTRLSGAVAYAQPPAYSPDGSTVAWVAGRSTNRLILELWLAPADASAPASVLGTRQVVPLIAGAMDAPVWRPDGGALAWYRFGGSGTATSSTSWLRTWVQLRDGSAAVEVPATDPRWSPDGTVLSLRSYGYAGSRDMYTGVIYSAESGHLLVASPTGASVSSAPSVPRDWPYDAANDAFDRAAAWSPDSSQLAVESVAMVRTGGFGVPYSSRAIGVGLFVAPVAAGPSIPGPLTWLGPWTTPRWSPDGRWLAALAPAETGGPGGAIVATPDGSSFTVLDATEVRRPPVWTVRPCAIAGRVTAAANGAPVAGVKVSVLEPWPSWRIVASTVSGADGSYSFGSLPEGSYRIRAFDPAGRFARQWYVGSVLYRDGTDVLVEGEGATVDLSLVPRPTGAVNGVVTDAVSGAPVPGAVVMVFTDAGYLGAATADAAGRYTFGGLAPGSYRLRIVDRSGTHLTRWHASATRAADATTVVVGVAAVTVDAAVPPVAA